MRLLPSRFRRRGRPLSCRELVELVSAYLEGTLDARERERFEAHLRHCDACPEYVEQLRATVTLTGRLNHSALSDAARRELLHAFRDWKQPPPLGQST